MNGSSCYKIIDLNDEELLKEYNRTFNENQGINNKVVFKQFASLNYHRHLFYFLSAEIETSSVLKNEQSHFHSEIVSPNPSKRSKILL